MRKSFGVMVAAMFLVGLAGTAWAVESSGPNFTFGASTSYAYDFNNPKDPNGALSGFSQSDFANWLGYPNLEAHDETFNIDLVQLGISGSRGKGSYGAKLDYGDLTRWVGDDGQGDIGLQTAYLTYDMGGAAVTAGRYDTPIGYEVIEPWGNANVSRSYSWTLLQPINHDGVFVSGNAGVIDGMLGVANSFAVHDQNNTPNDYDDEKAVLGAVGAGLSDALNLYFSMIYDEEQDQQDIQLYNAIISGKVPVNENNFRYAIEGNYQINNTNKGPAADRGETDSWSVVAYAGADFGPCSLDLRGEYLKQMIDRVGANYNNGNFDDTELWDITATAGWYMTDGLQLRLEYRYSASENGDVFLDKHSGVEDNDHLLQAQLVWYPEL